jgi:hypothetical protein
MEVKTREKVLKSVRNALLSKPTILFLTPIQMLRFIPKAITLMPI